MRRPRAHLLLALPMLLLAGCPVRTMRPASEAACLSKGGYMVSFTMASKPICAMPTADAGKACTDGSQCMGECVPKGWGHRGQAGPSQRTLPPEGEPIVGECTDFDEGGPFPNCMSYIRKGQLKTAACYD